MRAARVFKLNLAPIHFAFTYEKRNAFRNSIIFAPIAARARSRAAQSARTLALRMEHVARVVALPVTSAPAPKKGSKIHFLSRREPLSAFLGSGAFRVKKTGSKKGGRNWRTSRSSNHNHVHISAIFKRQFNLTRLRWIDQLIGRIIFFRNSLSTKIFFF